MTSFGLKVIRLGFAVLAKRAPDLGARLAYRLFCTTGARQPKSPKEKQVHAEGEAILAAAGKVRLSLADGSVMSYRFAGSGPASRRILLVHGWGSQARYLARMARGLAAAGHEVVVLDLPGHGESSGRTLDIVRAVEAVNAASRQYDGFDAIVGHSFGGATSLMAVSGLLPHFPPVKTGLLVLIGAPSRLDFIFEGFARMMGFSSDMLTRMEGEAERQTGLHPTLFDGVALARSAHVPLLVVHAEDDKEVPAENARRYENAAPFIETRWANGLGHRRIVSDDGVIAMIAERLAGRDEKQATARVARG